MDTSGNGYECIFLCCSELLSSNREIKDEINKLKRTAEDLSQEAEKSKALQRHTGEQQVRYVPVAAMLNYKSCFCSCIGGVRCQQCSLSGRKDR